MADILQMIFSNSFCWKEVSFNSNFTNICSSYKPKLAEVHEHIYKSPFHAFIYGGNKTLPEQSPHLNEVSQTYKLLWLYELETHSWPLGQGTNTVSNKGKLEK